MSAPSLSVPKTWDDITPAWMSAALAADFPGVLVDTVTVELRDDGTNRRARLGLTYQVGDGPATVFVKAADPAHKAMIRLTSGMFHEPRLFTCGVHLPLEHPAVYTALIDEADYDFVMVMEDLRARGADPRDGTRPMTVEQVATGVRGLARMHGRYWGERVLREQALGWLEPFVPWRGMEAAPLPAALERLGEGAPAEVTSLTIETLIDSIWKPYVATLTTSPQTLLHGDPHIGNTYLLPSGEVGFLDWQVARRGNWSLDLGYFLQGALTVEDRRQQRARPPRPVPGLAGATGRRAAEHRRDLVALPGVGRARADPVAGYRQRRRVAAYGRLSRTGATVFVRLRRPRYPVSAGRNRRITESRCCPTEFATRGPSSGGGLHAVPAVPAEQHPMGASDAAATLVGEVTAKAARATVSAVAHQQSGGAAVSALAAQATSVIAVAAVTAVAAVANQPARGARWAGAKSAITSAGW